MALFFRSFISKSLYDWLASRSVRGLGSAHGAAISGLTSADSPILSLQGWLYLGSKDETMESIPKNLVRGR